MAMFDYGGMIVNNTWPLIVEYNQRKILAKLGYTENLKNLDSYKAECFCHIANFIDERRAEALRQKK